MPKHSGASRVVSVTVFLALLVTCALGIAAQSGRRAPKSPPATAPVPLPEATPTPVATSEQPKPVLHIVVGIDRYDNYSSISIGTYDDVLRSCAQRLDEPQTVTVEQIQRPLSRYEASKRAKEEKNSYVVWLRVREDEMSSSTTGTANNVYIEYVVFAPITAKVVSSGSAYPRKKGIIPSSKTSGINGDREVIEAARTVANKILSALQMHIPTRPLSLF
jgi:hypothetical protein